MDANQLGKNIKHLREMHAETLEDLGTVIHCAQSTVKGYENGSRKPDLQTLQTIASHYNKPVDELLHTDLTKLGELPLNLNSISGIVELLNVMLPLYCTDAAMKSDSFKKGYKLSQRLLDGFANAEILPGNVIGRIFEKYLNAADESEELENGREILDAGFLCLHPVDVLI